MRPNNVIPIRAAPPIIVDYHKPLPEYDPHWGTTVTFLAVLSWVCLLAALHWALS